MSGPLIVTAELAASDFAWLDGLRRRHYPAGRNQVPAHLTLFRSLPPAAEAEARRALSLACAGPAPKATISGVMDLGAGVALRVRSDGLDDLRADLAAQFHGMLTAQDSSGWLPHVTIQNKADRGVVRALLADLDRGFEPRPIGIRGLLLFRYMGGPWEPVAGYRFRG